MKQHRRAVSFVNVCVPVNTGAHVRPCGQDPVKLTMSSGTIYSPGYDEGLYTNNARCQWLIEAPAGNVRHVNMSVS